MDIIVAYANNNAGLNGKLQTLKDMMQQLKSKANVIHVEVENEFRSRKRRKQEVDLWLEQARKIEEDVYSISREVETASILTCNRLDSEVEGLMELVEELLKRSEFPRGLVLDGLEPDGIQLVTEKLEGFTPSKVQDEVWSCFMKGESRIGICGVGGVGKTSVAMHINNEVLSDRDVFKHVYFVTVSRDASVYKLQNDISQSFNHKLQNVDETKRAAELSMALKEREKSLLILDDVWEDISMGKVGVTLEGDGCKLLITTRKRDVCLRMKCNTVVEMKPLPEKEARDLFVNQLANYEELSDEAKHMAEMVAKECSGLPLGIITMATCMRGVFDEHEWGTLLRDLQDPSSSQHDMNKVLNILKFSYDRLPDLRLQLCFLCCALYPEGWHLDRNELISRFIQLRLINGSSRHENIEDGHSLLNALENASLLECVTSTYNKGRERKVKMHDLVRDMAVRIIGRRGMIKASKCLTEVPGELEWNEDLEWACLQGNYINYIEGDVHPNYPKLLMLKLHHNSLSFISDSFFSYMPNLRVLDLSSTNISLVPDSVSELCNLNALLLSGCYKLLHIPSVRNLKKLSELDVKLCLNLKELPEGAEELVSLKHLDLRGTNIETIPDELMCNLCHLQTLLCNNKIIILPKMLERLRHLECFKGRLDDLEAYKQCVRFGCFNWWKRYSLHIGHLEMEFADFHMGHFDERHLKFSYCGPSIGTVTFFIIPSNVWSLEFTHCKFGVRSLLDAVPSISGASELESLSLRYCTTIEYIVSDRWLKKRGDAVSPPFTKIQQLLICGLGHFVGLIEVDVVHPHIFFGSLKNLSIHSCDNVKKLDLNLPNLEDVDIKCRRMEEIFETTEGVTIKLPNLIRLELKDLYALRRICWKNLSFPTLTVLELWDFRRVKKLGLLNYNLPSLNTLLIYDCKEIDELFEMGDEIACTAIQLPNLKKMYLSNLPELCSRFEKGRVEMLSLEDLFIHGCKRMEKILEVGAYIPNLKHLLFTSLSTTRKSVFMKANFQLPSLERITISDCTEVVHIFEMEDKPGQSVLRFPNLKGLHLRYLPALRSVFQKGRIELPSLEELEIKTCGSMEAIFDQGYDSGYPDIELPNLKGLVLTEVPGLKSIGRKTIVCDSLSYVTLSSAGEKLQNCPISIPRLLVNNNEPLPILQALGKPTGWWDSLHWNDSVTKVILGELGCLLV